MTSDCHDVLVSQSGPFGTLPDGTGGLERVDLLQKKSLGMAVSDTAMAGRPNTVTAECTGAKAAPVTPSNASATDSCTAVTVSGPAAGSYPLGDTKVTYTGPLTSHYHDALTAAATLTDPDGGAAITGKSISPGLFEVAALVGRERTHARLEAAVRLISSRRR